MEIEKTLFVFDLDGTITCSTYAWLMASKKISDLQGIENNIDEKSIVDLARNGVRPIIRMSTRRNPDLSMAQFWNLVENEFFGFVYVFDGIMEIVDQIRRNNYVSIYSNKKQIFVDIICDKLSISDRFDSIYGTGILPRKPEASGLKAIADRHGTAMSNVVYVGDHPVDIELSQRAGCRCVIVGWGYGGLKRSLVERSGCKYASNVNELGAIIKDYL